MIAELSNLVLPTWRWMCPQNSYGALGCHPIFLFLEPPVHIQFICYALFFSPIFDELSIF